MIFTCRSGEGPKCPFLRVLAYDMMGEIKGLHLRVAVRNYRGVFTSSPKVFSLLLSEVGQQVALLLPLLPCVCPRGLAGLTSLLSDSTSSLRLLHPVLHEATANWLMMARESKPVCSISVNVYDDSVGLWIRKPHWNNDAGKPYKEHWEINFSYRRTF